MATGGASVATASDDLQQEAEQVDDVQVDAERGKDIFFWTDAEPLVPKQHLSVECQELYWTDGKFDLKIFIYIST